MKPSTAFWIGSAAFVGLLLTVRRSAAATATASSPSALRPSSGSERSDSEVSADEFEEILPEEKMRAWMSLYSVKLVPASFSQASFSQASVRGAPMSDKIDKPVTEAPLAVAKLDEGAKIEDTGAYLLAKKNMNMRGKHYILTQASPNGIFFWPTNVEDAEKYASPGGNWKLFLRPDEAWDLIRAAGPAYTMNVPVLE